LQLVSSPDMPGTLKIVDMNLTKKICKGIDWNSERTEQWLQNC
jgi:hypothetical protein